MESPVRPVVANLCMEAIEESAISSVRVPPKIWKWYVNDSFVIIKKNFVSGFHGKLNSIDPMISVAMEKKIKWSTNLFFRYPSLQKSWFHRHWRLSETNSRDRYLDFNSHHEKKHKISTASTLLNRAYNLPSTTEGKSLEVNYVTNALLANGYPHAFISNVIKKKKIFPGIYSNTGRISGLVFLFWLKRKTMK